MAGVARRTWRAALVALALGVGLGAPPGFAATAAPPKPDYLPYLEFATDEGAPQMAAKHAYNEAAERYNKALYDYYVTLERHDQLVETYNRSASAAEQQKARSEARPLRQKLDRLAGEVKTLARAVDQARQRAVKAGVTFSK